MGSIGVHKCQHPFKKPVPPIWIFAIFKRGFLFGLSNSALRAPPPFHHTTTHPEDAWPIPSTPHIMLTQCPDCPSRVHLWSQLHHLFTQFYSQLDHKLESVIFHARRWQHILGYGAQREHHDMCLHYHNGIDDGPDLFLDAAEQQREAEDSLLEVMLTIQHKIRKRRNTLPRNSRPCQQLKEATFLGWFQETNHTWLTVVSASPFLNTT